MNKILVAKAQQQQQQQQLTSCNYCWLLKIVGIDCYI